MRKTPAKGSPRARPAPALAHALRAIFFPRSLVLILLETKPTSDAVEALKRKAAEKEAKKQVDEESSSSFDFEEKSDSASDSRVSTDLSSSATDEMRARALEMSLDAATHKKLSETLDKERTPVRTVACHSFPLYTSRSPKFKPATLAA